MVKAKCLESNGGKVSPLSTVEVELVIPMFRRTKSGKVVDTKEEFWIRIGDTVICVPTKDVIACLNSRGVPHENQTQRPI